MLKIFILIILSISCIGSLHARTWVQLVNRPIINDQIQQTCQVDIENNYINRYSIISNPYNRDNNYVGTVFRILPHQPDFQIFKLIDRLKTTQMKVIPCLESTIDRDFNNNEILSRTNHCISLNQTLNQQNNQHNLATLENHCNCYEMLYQHMIGLDNQ